MHLPNQMPLHNQIGMVDTLKKAVVISLYPVSATGGGENYSLSCATAISMADIECDLIAPLDRNFIYDRSERRFHLPFIIRSFIAGSLSANSHRNFAQVLDLIPTYDYVWIHHYLATASIYDLLIITHPEQKVILTNLGFEENFHDFWIRYNYLPNNLFIEISKYSAMRTKRIIKNVRYLYAGAWKKELSIPYNVALKEKTNLYQ